MLPINVLDWYYDRSDVGVIASIHEQCSYAAIEMMRKGLPVITSNADGLAEMFHNNGNAIVVPLEYKDGKYVNLDVIKYSEAIYALWKNKKQRMIMGKNGRRVFEKEYNLRHIIGRISKLYNSLF